MDLSFLRLHPKVKLVLKIMLSVAIVVILFTKLDLGEFWKVIRTIHPVGFMWALIWFVVSKWLSAERLQILWTADAIPISGRENIMLYWRSMYYNLLLPGGISGDAYKVKVISDKVQGKLKRIIALVFIDRISGLIALLQLSILLMTFVPVLGSFFWIFPIFFVLSFPALSLVCSFLDQALKSVWFKVSIYSVLVQSAQAMAALGLIYGLHQQQHALAYVILFFISSLAAMVPVTIGGAGARELCFIYGAPLVNGSVEQAVAIGFLFYIISTVVSCTGVFLAFQKNRSTES